MTCCYVGGESGQCSGATFLHVSIPASRKKKSVGGHFHPSSGGEARSLSYGVEEVWSRKGLSPHAIPGGIKSATFDYGCWVGGGKSRGLGAPAPFLSMRCR